MPINFWQFAGIVFIVLCIADAIMLVVMEGVTSPYNIFMQSVNIINLIEALILSGLVVIATKILERY